MIDGGIDGRSVRAVVLGAAVGLAVTVLAVYLIPVRVWEFTAELLGATAAAVTAVLKNKRGLRSDVVAAVAAEILRSLLVFLAVGVLLVLHSGEGLGFFAFFLLFGAGMAVLLALASIPVAALVGALASTTRRSITDNSTDTR